ncbi:hypothetical protein N5D37_12880 [Comamonas aquatica]|uniref:hypothetical protein n=1 Tax=Comamonas aquatica TaxID=225991 RepID=UPI00244D7621|nr:hypothetical protein [Comamonas aquatica]MDH1766521.1 hypothetical protein [Comamonas aquatica]
MDWERIELDYRAGIKVLRQIAGENGISEGAIRKRAKRDDWTRDLSERIQEKADQLVRNEAVRNLVRKESSVSERVLVEANAQDQASVRLSHRKDIQRKRAIVASLMDELEAQVGPDNAALLSGLGAMLRNPDENGQDKLNDLYRRVISLPERARTAKTLAETLRITVDMERQAFGMDAKGADGATPGAAGYVPPAIRVVHVTAPARQEDDDAGD